MGLIVIIGFAICDLIWWRAANRWLRAAQAGRIYRGAINLFIGTMFGYVVISMTPLSTFIRQSRGPLPVVMHASIYLWHFLILPLLMFLLLFRRWRLRNVKPIAHGVLGHSAIDGITELGRGAPASGERSRSVVPKARKRTFGPPGPTRPGSEITPQSTGAGALDQPSIAPPDSGLQTPVEETPPAETFTSSPAPTRRQMVAAAALAVPPLAACVAGRAAVRTLYGRRIRSFDLTIPQLPRQLDGMTIAHVSDTHIGKFFHPDRLPAIAEDINKLDADFIVFTGDLIDLALDDLPFGMDFLRSLKSRCGMAICEGNHDLMEDHGKFRPIMREAGLPFISDGQFTLDFTSRAGVSYPVQFLATPWNPVDLEMAQDVHDLRPSIREEAFPILLAHHPHSFDAAARDRLPLVLSGHTHGGQIMLNDQVGLGRLRFRYTSGLYQKNDSSLIVNNGLGNWFPVRINAPAELIHITLHSTGAAV